MSVTANQKLLTKLLAGATGMFFFAVFLMPPLYDLFCEVTGIGGKTKGPYEAVAVEVDTSREVVVQFVATNNEYMPWNFKPIEHSITVHPGERREVKFLAHNKTEQDMVAQAIPSMVPYNATDYFHKTECFCFNNQPLAAGEQAELPLIFIVDPDLPKSINTLTLSYTLFDITGRVGGQVAQLN